jgi:hypothetical protein
MSNISFNVPMIEQGDNDICWIACVAMITSFKQNASVGISNFTGGFDPSGSCIGDPNDSWEDLYRNLDRFGFTATGMNMSIDSNFILNMLRSHGPFMIFVTVADFPFSGPLCDNMDGDPDDTHALIVNGIDTDSQKVGIVNPWGTNVPPVDTDVIISNLQGISDSGDNPIAFMR